MKRIAFLLCLWIFYPAASTFAEVHSLVVLSQDDHSVYDMNPMTGQVLKQCQLDGAPREAHFSWNEQYLFVSVPDAGEVAIVDVKTFKQIGKIENAEFKKPVGGALGTPLGLAASSDGSKLYIGVEGGLLVYEQQLLIYNPEVQQTPKKIAVTPKDGQYFKVQGTTEKLYYPARKDNQVVVVDTKTDTVLKTIPVQGGPMDVVFLPGDEVWVDAADGSISIIDSSKDVVKQVIQTGGKGVGRIAVASDIRYVATTHKDSGDVTILQPMTKEVVKTVATGAGASSPAFAPKTESKGAYLPAPTDTLYVSDEGDSDVAVVDLTTMSVSHRQKVGKGLIGDLIHYTYGPGFSSPRESTDQRLLETDLFTVTTYRMYLYDVSPVHEHREDMVGVWIATGVAKNGCWDPSCPPEASNTGVGTPDYHLPYNNGYRLVSTIMHQRRGALHQEEGGSPSPPMSIMFAMKNNYYRQTQPPPLPDIMQPGFRKIDDIPRDVAYETTIWPGSKPVVLPKGDFAVVYLGGGLMRVVRDGKPEIVHHYYGDWAVESYAHTIEALTNPVEMVIVEFK